MSGIIRKFYHPLWAALLLVVVALAWPQGAAHACTPPPGGLPDYTPADYLAASPIVFTGRVMLTWSSVDGIPYGDVALISVDRYLKTGGPTTVIVSGFGPSSVCRSRVTEGQEYIFFAQGDPAGGDYQAFYLSQFDAARGLTPELLAEFDAAGAQSIGPDSAPSTPDAVMTATMAAVQAARASSTPTPYIVQTLVPPGAGRLTGGQIGAIVIVGIGAFLLGAAAGVVVGLRILQKK